MAGVTLSKITKTYGEVRAVDAVSLHISNGELLALLGPSGCGKTTTLRMIAGFVTPTEGQIRFGEQEVTYVPVHQRHVGMVFQGYALFPHLSVEKNIAFGLRVQGWDTARKEKKVADMLRWVQLEAMAERMPRALSGGQQQRVALARAMAIEPAVLLLDEPFSALDAKLRTQMRSEIRELQKEAAITSVFVTHDQEEAMAIADRIGVMNQGRLEQLGSAEDLYQRPASRFVATFIGKCNLLEGHVAAEGRFELQNGQACGFATAPAGELRAMCFRPEHARLEHSSPTSGNALKATVRTVTYLGAQTEYELRTAADERLLVSVASDAARHAVQVGDERYVCWDPAQCVLVA